MEIFLPDVKFSSPDLARECMGDADYPRLAMESLDQMVGARGFLDPFSTDRTQTAREGVLVRHLVLPGQVDDSIQLLTKLRRRFGRLLPLSAMSQFQPVPECHRRHRLEDHLNTDEYRRIINCLQELDFENIFIQELSKFTEFLPNFEKEQPFHGNAPR